MRNALSGTDGYEQLRRVQNIPPMPLTDIPAEMAMVEFGNVL